MRGLRYAFVLTATAFMPLAGQRPLTVTGIQSLTFATLLPGMPSVVSRTDAVKSGRFDLGGPHDAQGEVTFTLPSVLTGPAGATLPLSFGGSDAGYSQSQNIGSQVGFDPKQPFLITFSDSTVWSSVMITTTFGRREMRCRALRASSCAAPASAITSPANAGTPSLKRRFIRPSTPAAPESSHPCLRHPFDRPPVQATRLTSP